MRKREYAIDIREPDGKYIIVTVTEHFHFLNVLSQMKVANDLAVERIAHRILHYGKSELDPRTICRKSLKSENLNFL